MLLNSGLVSSGQRSASSPFLISIIKNTLKWYTQAGTVKATEELIASVFGGDARLIEWFDFTEPPIEANTFDVETESLMTKDIISELTSVIKKVKNSKSHIRRVTVLRELHPASTTHSQLNAQELAEQEIYPGTVRLSIGTEHIDDLIADLDQALAKI